MRATEELRSDYVALRAKLARVERLLHLIDRCYASEQRAAASEEMVAAAGQER